MRGNAGFSLIEMLVAMTIMALAAGLAVLSMGGGASLASETDRFVAALAAARDQSLIENRSVSVEVSDAGYSASVRSRLGPVIPTQVGAAWERGTSISNPDGRLPVVVAFDPVGLTEPVAFTLFNGRASERVSINGAGEIVRADGAP